MSGMSAHDAFWAANPDVDYWYYSPTLRVPNPKRRKALLTYDRKPWPNKEQA